MSNPRDHYTIALRMKAGMVKTYVETNVERYPDKYKSQLKTDMALLNTLLHTGCNDFELRFQMDNIVDQCVFAEEALNN